MASKKSENEKTSSASEPEFVITRPFDAPRGAVWKAFSDRDALARWWGPKGCKITIANHEFRPGGFFHYAMQYSTGAAMWGRFLYRDIAAPERMVWLTSFSNPGCGITRAPFHSSIPLEIQNVMTLAEQNGKTTLVLRATPFGASEEEREFFAGFFASLNQGFSGTFDQLEAYLANP